VNLKKKWFEKKNQNWKIYPFFHNISTCDVDFGIVCYD